MILTWKRWASFFIIAVVSFFACQFYAETNLIDMITTPTWEAERATDLPGTFQKFKNLVQNVQSVKNLPWPIRSGIVNQRLRDFDPKVTQNIDAETLMGLAILGPQCEEEHEGNDLMKCGHNAENATAWFNQVSEQAINRAADASERQKLRQFQLFVQSNSIIFGDGHDLLHGKAASRGATSQPVEEGKSSIFGQQIVTRSRNIDSRNSLYRYFSIYPDLMVIKRKIETKPKTSPLPSEKMAEVFSLAEGVDLTALADQINSKLTQGNGSGKLNLFHAYRLKLNEKAQKFYWKDHPQFRTLQGTDLAERAFIAHLDGLRDTVTRLCFLGDRLAARGERERALAMYRYAYKIGEQMMLGDGIATPYFQVEVGRTLTSGVSEHLIQFWAGQGNVPKTLRAKEMVDFNQILIKQEIEKLRLKGADPFGDHESTYEIYVRMASLTWWLGMTGVVFAIASLISTAVFMLLMRGRVLTQDKRLEISYKLLEMGLGVPIFLMILLTMIIPLKLNDFYVTGSLLTWMWILMLLWLIIVGLLALFSGSESEGIRRSPGRRIWIFTALGVAASCLVASVISDEMMPVIAVGIGSVVIGVGFFIWLVVTMITWLVQRSLEDRRSRARANLAFSVCAMLASAVFLISSLASMPLTRYHQDRYFNQAMDDVRSETGFFLGDNWPASFKGLPETLFKIGK